jgi:hypothetical protein
MKNMRVIDEKFVVVDNRIVKRTTGEEVPETEPTILFRGRDRLALPMLEFYRSLCEEDGATDFQMQSINRMIARFKKYAEKNPVKQPGITEGKVWDGTPS